VLKRTIDASIDIPSRRHRLLRSLVPLNNLNDRTTSALLDDDYSIQQLLGSSAPSLRDRPPQLFTVACGIQLLIVQRTVCV
jgi:hypothetical protein